MACLTRLGNSGLRKIARTSLRLSQSPRTQIAPMSTASFPSTPDLCDAFEETIRIVDPSLGFRNFGGKTLFGGQVVTVICFEDNSLVKQLAKTDGTGKVMVVDGGGSRRRALLGDQVALDCVKSGWEGLVIYGSIRDVDEIGELELGVQTLGPAPMKTIKRNEGQTDIPVTFGGATFTNGDCVVCDNNGIVVNAHNMRSK
jgi:regulator of ribonuclease activity A